MQAADTNMWRWCIIEQVCTVSSIRLYTSQRLMPFLPVAGSDLLRLSRDDLIQICGLADGIRLNNALQSRYVLSVVG